MYACPVSTEQMVADSRSDSNASTRRANAAHHDTQDRAAMAHQPATWPKLIRKRREFACCVTPPGCRCPTAPNPQTILATTPGRDQ